MSYLDKVTVGGATYDIADSAARAGVDELKSAISGIETEITPTLIGSLDFQENATKYTASGTNYATKYIQVVKGKSYTFNFLTTNVYGWGIRYAFAEDIPAINVNGTYIGKNVAQRNVPLTYVYEAEEDGYFSISYYVQPEHTVTVTALLGGLEDRVTAVEAETESTGEAVEDVRTEIDGTLTELTATLVSGLDFAENATKYTAGSAYSTYYIPVTKGMTYYYSFLTTNDNGWGIKFALAKDIPAVNVNGTYIEKKTASKNTPLAYTYTATANGYHSFSYWTEPQHTFTVKAYVGGIKQNVIELEAAVDAGESTIEAVNSRMQGIEDEIHGTSVALETGGYWGGLTIGVSTESNLQLSTNTGIKRTMVSLPAGKTLRIVTTVFNNDNLGKPYYAFNADTTVCIDFPEKYSPNVVYSYYLRYEGDAHVYINCKKEYTPFIGIVDETSPYVDISSVVGVSKPSVMEANDAKYVVHAVKSLKRGEKNQRAPAVFIHCSDLHGDAENIKRLVAFKNDIRIKSLIDDTFISGDIVADVLADGMEFFTGVTGSEDIILTAGNHEAYKTKGPYTGATKAETYEAVFADLISGWNVTQPEDAEESSLCYFYKDYATPKLRVIYADPVSAGVGTTYISDETTWFESVLLGAYNAGYSVMVVEHYPFKDGTYTFVDCSFSPRNSSIIKDLYIPEAWVSAVEDYIDYGGDFVCWLSGHSHQDYVLLNNNTHQLCIGVSCATHISGNLLNTSHSDDLREEGTKSQDMINLVGVDTYSKNISIMRIGSDLTRLMNSKRHLCLNYGTRTLVWND